MARLRISRGRNSNETSHVRHLNLFPCLRRRHRLPQISPSTKGTISRTHVVLRRLQGCARAGGGWGGVEDVACCAQRRIWRNCFCIFVSGIIVLAHG